ncbi:MAG TPA: PEP/pyruvate-binding domain-containing protein [bacterium]|nr:PEP/pyruvate-binding domain-containing protein [bacterium]
MSDIVGIGGKGRNLLLLERMGLKVPPWYVIRAETFRYVLSADGSLDKIEKMITDSRPPQSSTLRDIREIIRIGPWMESYREILRENHSRILGTDVAVAVRSSALDEDSSGFSFAGQHDSVLFVRGIDDLERAIRKVWSSLYSDRAISYRIRQELPIQNLAIAVVIQKMVDAKAAGVMFTMDPVSGDTRKIVIHSVWGLGEGLVSEGFDADRYELMKPVDQPDNAINRSIVSKPNQIVPDDRWAGVVTVPVSDDQREAPSLSDAIVRELARVGEGIESIPGRPQDIEFAIDANNALFFLQTRPVTTAAEYGPAAGNHLIWDNSNIIESYAGVTTPMTFSFIRHAYTIVYHCFAEVMGVPPAQVRKSRPVFENMLGLINGRVYYNLLNWYRLIRLFPGFDFNKTFMESMMGVKEPTELRDEYPEPARIRRYTVELYRLGRLIVRSANNFRRLEALTDAFQSRFETLYSQWESMDFSELKPHELMRLYHSMEEKLLWNWKAPIINDFFVMIYYGILKNLCKSWCADSGESLQNDLICGEKGIQSTEPTRMLLMMAGRAQKDTKLKAMIMGESPEIVHERVFSDDGFKEFREDVSMYLNRFGYRCINELKLEEYSLRDHPGFLYAILRNYLMIDRPELLDVDAMDRREQSIRSVAEQRAFGALSAQRFSGLKHRIFRRVLANARKGVKNRENMRFARTRIYGLLREVLRALGSRFSAEGIISDRDDIFFLTLDECWDYIKGTAVTTHLGDLISLRRREFDGYKDTEAESPDDRFETYGMVYHRNRFKSLDILDFTPEDGLLRGVGCCPGRVTGPVKVLESPREDVRLNGEILVAERTDPGWVPLYPAVSGILIERGSILSHSAIVAREMGIPTIVGIPHLISILDSGRVVTMDGAAGTVSLVD